MSVVFIVGDKFPETCCDCPLFTDDWMQCQVDGEYTEEEIASAEDGELNMYYHGCLESRPKNCPLKEAENE